MKPVEMNQITNAPVNAYDDGTVNEWTIVYDDAEMDTQTWTWGDGADGGLVDYELSTDVTFDNGHSTDITHGGDTVVYYEFEEHQHPQYAEKWSMEMSDFSFWSFFLGMAVVSIAAAVAVLVDSTMDRIKRLEREAGISQEEDSPG